MYINDIDSIKIMSIFIHNSVFKGIELYKFCSVPDPSDKFSSKSSIYRQKEKKKGFFVIF